MLYTSELKATLVQPVKLSFIGYIRNPCISAATHEGAHPYGKIELRHF